MRVVIDTNIIVSAIFYGGKPQHLLNTLIKNKIECFANEEIVAEYQRIIKHFYSKRNYFCNINEYNEILKYITISHTNDFDLQICRDSKDNIFINCALTNKCDYIITGDNDLLVIKQIKNTKIVTISEMMAILNGD